MPDSPFTVIVPVKSTRHGKSRLRLPARAQVGIARAIALDTIFAVTQVAPALVVVEDADDALYFRRQPGLWVHRTAAIGLNESVLDGVAVLTGAPGLLLRGPTPGAAVLPGDLPGLDPADLDAALCRAADHPGAVVADHQGTGTTLLTALQARLVRPQYGPGSFARHAAAGAVPLPCPEGCSLRMDIDEPADLGGDLGPRTRAALLAAGEPGVDAAARPEPAV